LLPISLSLILAPLLISGVNATAPFFTLFSLAALAILIHKLQQLQTGQLSMRFGAFEALTVAFVVLAGVSATTSVNPYVSITELHLYIAYVMLAWGIRKSVEDKRALYLLIGSLLLGSSAVSCWGIRQYVEQLKITGDAHWRIFSTFYNPNLLAGYLGLTLPLAVSCLLVVRERAWKLLLGFVTALNATAFLLTGSKGGVLGLSLAAIVAAAAWRSTSPHRQPLSLRKAVPTVCALLVVGFLAARPLIPRLLAAFGSESHSSQFRWYLWKSTARIIADFPLLGAGPGTFESIYPRYALAGFTRMAHENYLQLAAEGGLLFAVVFIAMLVVGLRGAARGVRGANRESSLLSCGLLGGLVAFGVHGLVDYTWYVPSIAITYFAMLSLTHSLVELRVREQRYSSPRGPLFTVTFGNHTGARLCLALIVLFLVTLSYSQWRISGAASLYDEPRGARAEGPHDPIAAARRSVQLQPRCGRYHARLAEAIFMRATATADEGELMEAAQEFQTAITCEPTVSNNYYKLARLRSWNHERDKGRHCLQSALLWNPNYTSALILWGELLTEEERNDEARKKYEKVIAISDSTVERYKAIPDLFDENYIKAHIGIGKLEIGGNNCTAARKQLDRALEWCETYLKSQNPMLNTTTDLDIPQVAAPKSAVRRLKAEALAWKGKSYLVEGNQGMANTFFNEALETDPDIAGELGSLTDNVR